MVYDVDGAVGEAVHVPDGHSMAAALASTAAPADGDTSSSSSSSETSDAGGDGSGDGGEYARELATERQRLRAWREVADTLRHLITIAHDAPLHVLTMFRQQIDTLQSEMQGNLADSLGGLYVARPPPQRKTRGRKRKVSDAGDDTPLPVAPQHGRPKKKRVRAKQSQRVSFPAGWVEGAYVLSAARTLASVQVRRRWKRRLITRVVQRDR